MDVADFDYPLPEAAIAQTPVEPRHDARLLVAVGGTMAHRRVRDLPGLVGPGDVLVVNDSRVLPARLHLTKATGGQAEVLLLEREGDSDTWTALVRPGRRLPAGTVLHAGERPVVEVGAVVDDDGARRVRLLVADGELDRLGTVPLPPYVHAQLDDPERYQTVYARRPVSVAAPTAGLHLTPEVIDACRVAGASVTTVELAVGLGTFKPMTSAQVEDHVMHGERYVVPPETMTACAEASRVIAIGTTVVRALESAAAGENEGRTELFIHGEHRFRVVDVLLTNFHLPKSSLLVLLAAFCGSRWRALYDEALAEGYRFLSFGDAMLIDRRP
ncbi:MAG TPA: tRNA preQ1(34) S-adenosylmethionine ribosyltransferase-isomerase QueA [Acidimicrobiales bacterium]|nr:tRNA preQ1(34) S-adenosylmethionine ribosyltransferase-isomerase QueA [Acidimicrobiales bacterium]